MNNLDNLLNFIDNSPVSIFAIDNIKKMLSENGYIDGFTSTLAYGNKYYFIRNDSSIIAVDIPEILTDKLKMVSSHSDSPCFKIKSNPTFYRGGYTLINIAAYGGMIIPSFIDKPLSIAGRVSYIENNDIVTKFIDFIEPCLVIPNLAIHLNREINQGYKYVLGKDVYPILGRGKINLFEIIKEKFAINHEIISHDLYVYSCTKSYTWGEFFSSPRIDNLECAYCSTTAFLETSHRDLALLCIFDNEEVGSLSYMGAASNFLTFVIDKIAEDLNISKTAMYNIINNSFVVSADNAHGIHPNYLEKYDSEHLCYINDGIIIKFSNNQAYTTDGVTAAQFMNICKLANVPYQKFENHSSSRGGSTLGNLLNYHTSFHSVDIGLPQLAMHSCVETAGIKDVEYMIQALKEYYVR